VTGGHPEARVGLLLVPKACPLGPLTFSSLFCFLVGFYYNFYFFYFYFYFLFLFLLFIYLFIFLLLLAQGGISC